MEMLRSWLIEAPQFISTKINVKRVAYCSQVVLSFDICCVVYLCSIWKKFWYGRI